jgi:uridine kinase
MEAGLKRVFADAVIGKLLIQTDPKTGDPEVGIFMIVLEIHANFTMIILASLL